MRRNLDLARRATGAIAGLAAVLTLALAAAPGCAADPQPHARIAEAVPLAPPGVPTDRFPKPVRPVAGIVSDQWSTEDTRERAGEAATVMDLLGVKLGLVIADIGAGSGYYTVRLARRVGPTGKVFAEDVMASYLGELRRRLERENVGNVALALGEPGDPRLPRHAVDLVLMVHMYHEIEQPYALLANLLPSLRPGARVAILDANRPTSQHGTPPQLLACELTTVGYREVGWHWLEDKASYLAVFEPPTQPPVPERITPCRPPQGLQ